MNLLAWLAKEKCPLAKYLYLPVNKPFVTTFLDQAVQRLLQLPQPLNQITVVMPSQRAAVFLRRALLKQLTKPSFSPQFITVENLVAQSTGLQILDNAPLLFKLYEAYLEGNAKPENFTDFSKWAPLLLADFNEVDRHLIEAKKLFSHLADVKRMESWNLEPEPTELIKNYRALWQSLPPLYQRFTARLKADGAGYQGLAYRLMAENLETLLPQLSEQYGHFFFIGFNALNQAEETIFTRLYEEGKADFFWDIDTYYFNNKDHEAGQFLRSSRLVKRLKEKQALHGLHSSLSTEAKKIETLAISGQHLQAAVANQLVGQFTPLEQQQTAVVLADEALLNPFLNNLSAQIEQLNVTMGLPLQRSPLAGFFEVLLGFPRSWECKKQQTKNGEPLLYHQQWDDLLAQPLLKQIIQDAAAVEKVRRGLQKRNWVYASYRQLLELGLPPILPAELFAAKPPLPAYFKVLARFCEQAKTKSAHRQTQMLFGFYQLFNQLSQLFAKYPYVADFDAALHFYRDLLRQQTVDLRGEPLQGLQLMGMLETRTLDFKNVVLCSVNEEILPQGRSANSLIPFDLKKAFGLPTFLDKDAIYAYHFYRLLQRAKNIYLLYNNGVQGLKMGEPSRFIRQVEMELQKHHRQKQIKSSFTQNTATVATPVSASGQEVIVKTPAVMQRLEVLAQEGFSPSALATYLRNPIDFYYQYVLRLREPDQLEEELDLRTQGNVAHQILEGLYGFTADGEATRPKSTAQIAENFALDFKAVQQQVQDFLKYQQALPKVDRGLNLLATEVITNMVHGFLQLDKKRFAEAEETGEPIELKGLEQSLTGVFKRPNGQIINLKGNADRIEQRGATWYILDYKTGNASESDYKLSTNGFASVTHKPKALQLLLYGYMLLQKQANLEEVKPQVVPLKNLRQGILDLKLTKHSTGMQRQDLLPLEETLENIFSGMYNPALPFTQTPPQADEDP
jgi:hypothetical protein